MQRIHLVPLLLATLLLGCDGGGGGTIEDDVIIPEAATVPVERGLIVRTGELLDTPNFKIGDINVFKGNTAAIRARCPVKITECLPIHICRPSASSLPEKFDSLDAVCATKSDVVTDQLQAITDVYDGMGFVARLAESDDGFGYVRVWVKDIDGAGPGAVLHLEYDLLPE
ncbi:MAG: hypothetical protein ABIK09_10290 [Pseudomonadota bacterium]